MNISSAVNYPSSGTPSYYPKGTTIPDPQTDTVNEAASQDPQVQAEKAKEQKARDRKIEDQKNQDKQAEEQKLEKQERYHKEDRVKEIKKEDTDKFLQNQQKQNLETSEIAADMLAQNAYLQMGTQANLPITKDNYEEAVKHLAARGFQVKMEEDKLLISSKVHQLKLEISRESYDQYVHAAYGPAIAEQSVGNRPDTVPAAQPAMMSTGRIPADDSPTSPETANNSAAHTDAAPASGSTAPESGPSTSQQDMGAASPPTGSTSGSASYSGSSATGNETTATGGTKGPNNGKASLVPGLL